MSSITITNLTFAYPGHENIFTNQNLTLDTSWHLGLTGRNGRGKTTLLNLLRGKLHGGSNTNIAVPVTLNYFPQTIPDETLDAWQVVDAVSDVELWQVQRELTQMGVAEDVLYRPYATLSGGEQTKLLLAVLFADTVSFTLIDEPTNHLDHAGRQQVAAYLARKDQGFIVISHDRDFLDAATDHTLTIEKQQLVLTQGNFGAYEHAKARKDQNELDEQAKLKKDIGRLKQSASAKADWSMSRESDIHGDPHVKGSGGTGHSGFVTARAARLMKKSKTIEHRMDKEIADKEALLKNIEYIDPLALDYAPDHHQVLLRVRDLTLSFNGQPLFAPLTFEVKRGDRVALVGPNGAGKSSLLAAILQQATAATVTGQQVAPFTGTISGEIDLAQSASRALVRQQYADNKGLLPAFAEARKLNFQDLLNNLHKLGVERSVFNVPIEEMSGGQQKKVELAASMATTAAFYIWDEPLNYLDVFNQDQIIQVLKQVQPTMLFTEHDTHFIDAVATKTIELQPLTK
ncbi:ribosomal protection-like ABC-F family protein [Lacticaseibacillus sharpeae]|uniref:ABC transporter, ATP-binding protein n=1 Tax=Lacticaseibacillus sharpeae JCM 1186 = DSM 20505 TaxID=1291052 RepID=A0A0R1ZKU5_9LACO|nr:ATP-binding cassette domain-containing protein [Lacticaseibacillus sharpeae]KRM55002.1 ABC transporter, ATP-binding protein [Lacticaseibacillus sharpeae JCM 1186 = DSM 20505]